MGRCKRNGCKITVLTLEEVKERLAERYDELQLVALFQVTSESLVNRYSDLIEDDLEHWQEILEEDGGEQNDDDSC